MIFNMGSGASNAEVVQYDNSESNLTSDNVQDAIDEMSEAFQAGCDTIVSGITAYGVTPASNSPADIVSGVKGVYDKGVKDTKVGTARQAQVLSGYTFTCDIASGSSGTMKNNGAVIGAITTSGGIYTIPAGYHNGSGKVTGPTLETLVGSNVTLANAGHLLTGYTAYGKNGTKYTGSMANKTTTVNHKASSVFEYNNANLYFVIPENGFYSTGNRIYSPNEDVATAIGLTADKIVKGNTVLGMAGTGGVPTCQVCKTDHGVTSSSSTYTATKAGYVIVNLSTWSNQAQTFTVKKGSTAVNATKTSSGSARNTHNKSYVIQVAKGDVITASIVSAGEDTASLHAISIFSI